MHIHNALYRGLSIVVFVTLLLLGASLSGTAAPAAHPAASAGWQEVGDGPVSGRGIRDNSRSSGLPPVAVAPDGILYTVRSDDSRRDDKIYAGRWNGNSWAEVGASAPITVTIRSPATGIVDVTYTFTATVSPVTATQPITYVWQATEQSVITHTVGDLDDTVNFTWTTPSSKLIFVTASNAVDTVTNTHVITIISNTQQLFLPIIIKSYHVPPGCSPDNYEPNDSCDQAYGPLTSGQTYQSWISDCDLATYRTDYFYIDISTANAINIDLTNIPAGTDYDLYLYKHPCDGPGNPVAKSDNYGTSPETISYNPPATGRYYIRVYSYSGYSTSPYSLRVIYD